MVNVYSQHAEKNDSSDPRFDPPKSVIAAFEKLKDHNTANGKSADNPFIDKMLRGNARSDEFMSNVSTLLAGSDGYSDYQKMKVVDEWAAGGFQPVARDSSPRPEKDETFGK